MRRSAAEFRAEEALVLTEALARAQYELQRRWGIETGCNLVLPTWENAGAARQEQARYRAAEILRRGGGIHVPA